MCTSGRAAGGTSGEGVHSVHKWYWVTLQKSAQARIPRFSRRWSLVHFACPDDVDEFCWVGVPLQAVIDGLTARANHVRCELDHLSVLLELLAVACVPG